MELNNIIFSAPTPSYTLESLKNLIWIPRTRYFSMKRITNNFGSSEKQTPNSSVKFPEFSSGIIFLYFLRNAKKKINWVLNLFEIISLIDLLMLYLSF